METHPDITSPAHAGHVPSRQCLCSCHQLALPCCSQHFPAQGLKQEAAGGSREWVWGGKGTSLQQWPGLSELLQPQFITTHTHWSLYSGEMSQDAASDICKSVPPQPREAEWEETKVPGCSTGLLCLLHIFSAFCWAPQAP